MKVCPGCKQELALSGFWRNTRLCKECEYKYHRNRGRQLGQAKILSAIEKLGNQCTCCGETTREFLTFDHINGRASLGHARNFTGYKVAVIILALDDTSEYRILCMNCNYSYGIRGYCPHRPFSRFGKFSPTGVRKGKKKRSTFMRIP